MPSSIPEEAVRKYLELDWTNRKIARELKTSATSVQRVRTKINTGPNPVLRDETAPPADEESTLRRRPVTAAVVLAVALTVLAVAAAGLIWDRFLRPADTPLPPAQYTLCVQVSPSGAVSGIASGSDGTCPPRWTAVILVPGH